MDDYQSDLYYTNYEEEYEDEYDQDDNYEDEIYLNELYNKERKLRSGRRLGNQTYDRGPSEERLQTSKDNIQRQRENIVHQQEILENQ